MNRTSLGIILTIFLVGFFVMLFLAFEYYYEYEMQSKHSEEYKVRAFSNYRMLVSVIFTVLFGVGVIITGVEFIDSILRIK